MVLTATIAMMAMTTTMTMKMHPFYPKPTYAQLIAYKSFLRERCRFSRDRFSR